VHNGERGTEEEEEEEEERERESSLREYSWINRN
jgi:hypothetical protein